jgi:alpha-amylase/alpha-mannosidase (GH57 family)
MRAVLITLLLAGVGCSDPGNSDDASDGCPDGFSLVDGVCRSDGGNNGANNGTNNGTNNGGNNGGNNGANNGANNGGNNGANNGNNGGPCVTDADCETDQVCEDGACYTPDLTGPKLINAFSSEGGVTLRFDESLATGADALANFSIQGSDNSTLAILDARLDTRFVHLSLDPNAQINPQLTYEVLVSDVEDLAGNPLDRAHNRKEIKQALYLNIIWHQHQPLYHDPVKDELIGPWVRKHATKDYYDMTDLVTEQPDIHFNVNLTSVLLQQLILYIDRMKPYVDLEAGTLDEEAFFAAWRGKTDAHLDFLLADSPEPPFDEDTIELVHRGAWTLVSTSDALMSRFPEYEELRDQARDSYTQLDVTKLKIWFEIAWFDPDFLEAGGVELVTGQRVDLSDVLVKSGGKFTLRETYTTGTDEQQLEKLETLANRLAVENYRVMEAVIPLHQQLLYDPDTKAGKIEVMTTPFYHPILPLIYDTDLAAPGLPADPLPNPAFAYPDDAYAQVARAVQFYTETFGVAPRGMWPGEGSVAEEVVETFAANDIEWIATDARVLERSNPPRQPLFYPYKVDADTSQGTGGDTDDEVLIVFRDGPISDKIGFAYQTVEPEVASDDFINNIVQVAPGFGQPDRMMTVILDGENAWESYTKSHDGKATLRAVYRKLQESYDVGEIITVTTSEYIHGNLDRGVPPHPITDQRELEPLWPGSWIDGTFATWIGETEENIGWGYLLRTRSDLAASGVPRPNPALAAPPEGETFEWYAYRAWEAMYAAQGSDWFWWFGKDQETPGNDDTGFDRAFRAHLGATYQFMNLAACDRRAEQGNPCEMGVDPFPQPNFAPIVQANAEPLRGPFVDGEEPTIDGAYRPDETEWNVSAGSFFDNDSGAINNPNDDIRLIYFGYVGEVNDTAADDALYLTIESVDDLSAKEDSNYEFRVYFNHKHITNADLGEAVSDPANAVTRSGDEVQFIGDGPARELRVNLGTVPAVGTLSYADGRGGWSEVQNHDIEVGGAIDGGRIIELKIPLADLGMQLGDPLEFAMQAVSNETVIDTAPNLGTRIMFDDITNLVFVTFAVDVTGDLNRYTNIANPPPPEGRGTVFITGNQDALENWTPNSLPMKDDGVAPDETAGDGHYTRTFGFRPGVEMRYKFTIGTPQDYDRWPNTEEFPLTERGFRIPIDCPSKKLTVRDIWADRPQPSGSLAPNATVTCEQE